VLQQHAGELAKLPLLGGVMTTSITLVQLSGRGVGTIIEKPASFFARW
jgi:hypothetical protein